MIGTRCRPLLRQIPTCFRKLSLTANLQNPVYVRMPALSPTMVDGGIVSWLKNEGDEVSAGDGLCEIQTDKAVVTMEIEEDGILAKILKPENSMGVPIGELIALIAEDGEDVSAVSELKDESSPSDRPSSISDDTAPATSRYSPDAEYPPLRDYSGSGIGPAVRLLLELYRLKQMDITATGPHGRLLKGDVLAHITHHQLSPQPPTAAQPPKVSAAEKVSVVKSAPPPSVAAPLPPLPSAPTAPEDVAHVDLALTNEQSALAQAASLGKRSVPHSYANVDVELNRIAPLLEADPSRSIVQFVVKAAANALQAVPDANSYLTEDGSSVPHSVVNIAVLTSSSKTPCLIHDVLGITSSDIGDILRQHSENESGHVGTEGATFTVVDLSDTNVEHAAAIVSPPQIGVLTIGGVQEDVGQGAEDGRMVLTSRFTATLSMDRRIMDESAGASFLFAFKTAMEELVATAPMTKEARDPLDDILGIGLD